MGNKLVNNLKTTLLLGSLSGLILLPAMALLARISPIAPRTLAPNCASGVARVARSTATM